MLQSILKKYSIKKYRLLHRKMPNWPFFMPYARSLYILTWYSSNVVSCSQLNKETCAGVILNIQKMIAV